MSSLAGVIVAEHYRVDAPLGEGGMASVWRGVDVRSGRAVAIKTVLPELIDDDVVERRLEREAQAAGFLRHPNVVEVLALDRIAGAGLALVMELVSGPSLRDVLDHGALAPRRALVLTRQILGALALAHQSGIVHRDLKPENVVLTRVGQPGATYEVAKLLDFGLVKLMGLAATMLDNEKLTRTGMVHGTPVYMAPEQALNRPHVDGRVDLYAIGVMLFEMLTGAPPFDGKDAVTVLRRHISEPPPTLAARSNQAPWATGALEKLVAGALAKRVDERFADAAAMTAALDDGFRSIDHVPDPS